MTLRRALCALGVAVFLSACADQPAPTAPVADDLLNTSEAPAAAAQMVDVIVVLRSDFAPGGHAANQAEAGRVARGLGISPRFAYGTALFGFAGAVPAGRLNALSRDPRVAYWELDQMARIPDPGIRRPPWERDPPPDEGGDPGDGGSSTQSTPWWITRVKGGVSYSGSNVAWIIDTGIDLDHPDLNVDASKGYNAFTWGKDGKSLDDGNGHGTHVAGTVAAIDNTFGVIGVAAGATVVPVKVLSSQGSGSYSGVIAGVDHVAANGSSDDVANMSLGGPVSTALDNAVIAAAGRGVKFSLAAGNESDDADNHSPARANGTNIYTVSAMEQGDRWAYFSNYGNPPVDYAAPGRSIESTWKNGGYNTISGTSMAAPHVAGILLLGNVSSGGTVSGDPDGNPDPIAVH
jgi:subtilisin family serine protease